MRLANLDRVLNPEDAGGDPPQEAESSSAYPDAGPDEDVSFIEEADASNENVDEPVGDGPASTPSGTLSDSEEGDSEQASNSGDRLTAGLQLSAVGITLTMCFL